MSTELPGWTDYTVQVSEEHADYLERSAVKLGGLRIMNLGGGKVALDDEAVADLKRLPDDADGGITDDENGLQLWLEGSPYPVNPADPRF